MFNSFIFNRGQSLNVRTELENLGELRSVSISVSKSVCSSSVHSFIQPPTAARDCTVLVTGTLHRNTMTLHSFPTKAGESVKNNSEGN